VSQVSKNTLMAKAKGITTSISRQPGDMRSRTPTGVFADDYNRLVELVLSRFPHLSPVLPPKAAKYQGGGGDWFSGHSYAEIDSFAEQLFQILSEVEE
jgi:hypothetical protein